MHFFHLLLFYCLFILLHVWILYMKKLYNFLSYIFDFLTTLLYYIRKNSDKRSKNLRKSTKKIVTFFRI